MTRGRRKGSFCVRLSFEEVNPLARYSPECRGAIARARQGTPALSRRGLVFDTCGRLPADPGSGTAGILGSSAPALRPSRVVRPLLGSPVRGG